VGLLLRAVPEPPSILVKLCHVDNNVITIAWQQGHVLTGNDVSYALELDDGDAGPFRVGVIRQTFSFTSMKYSGIRGGAQTLNVYQPPNLRI